VQVPGRKGKTKNAVRQVYPAKQEGELEKVQFFSREIIPAWIQNGARHETKRETFARTT